jgi:proteasome lid subunit RPN8/RPN11
VIVERDAYQTIVSHAAQTYPEECCGAIVGSRLEDEQIVREAWPVENVAETREHRFTIAPADYLKIERRARASGVTLIGFYHSHPDAPARPSSYDLAHAWPGVSYLIVAVAARVPGDAASWRLREDRSGFDNEEMTWPPAS